jgi:hypothetical protein
MMSQSDFLKDVFSGPDLYVNWPRTGSTFPWDETYKPTPYSPPGNVFYGWDMYRMQQTNADSPYFMSQESATTPDVIPSTPAPKPTSCQVSTIPQICPTYNGEPLPSVYDPYRPPQISINDMEVGCGALFKQETCQGGSCNDEMLTLGIFLLLGGIIAYAAMLALRK